MSRISINKVSASDSSAVGDLSLPLTEWFCGKNSPRRIKNLPPVITTGSVWTLEDCCLGMGMGADLIGTGRASIGNWDWAQRICDADAIDDTDGCCADNIAQQRRAGKRESESRGRTYREPQQYQGSYQPFWPPYTEEHLRSCGLSPIFVYYMRRWKFVKDARGNVLPFQE